MDIKIRKRFAEFIKAELSRKDTLNVLFSTQTPTETDLQRHIDNKNPTIKSKIIAAKTIQKFLND